MEGAMTLRRFGDPILKAPATHVAPDADVSGLVYELKETLAVHRGLGLAAQQIGSTQRVALITVAGKVVVAINLEIVERSKATVLSTHEGCLSVRQNGRLFRMNVRRHQHVVARWEDEDRREHTQRLGGLDAIVAQHEAEHLDGRCIVDRLEPHQLERLASAVAA
jgi:peptide deformylase